MNVNIRAFILCLKNSEKILTEASLISCIPVENCYRCCKDYLPSFMFGKGTLNQGAFILELGFVLSHIFS